MRIKSVVLRVGIALGVFTCVAAGSSNAMAAQAPAAADTQWPGYGRDSNEQRFSPLKQINVNTVKDLGLAWAVDMPEKGSQQSTPIMVDGILYVTTPWSYLNAYDAKTGRFLWKYNPKVPREIGVTSLCCGNQNRGAAYWNGKIVLSTLDGRLVAVDAKKGTKIWETATFDPMKDAMSITGAPRIANGIVFIGQGGGEFHQRGFMSAYNADTGKKLWKFFLVPGDPSKGPDGEASDPQMAMAAKTWKGDWWKTGGGATVWDGIVYDKVNDLVIFGTGNGAPWPAELRSPGGGDNLFTASIVALEARTGKYKWHYQTVPMESFDFDNTSPLTIADITVAGEKQHVVMQLPKNGVFYVIEAGTGKVISAQLAVPFANWLTGFDKQHNWAPILNPQANYGVTKKGWWVLPFQAHNWTPQSFSPDTGLVYVGVRNASYGMVAEAGAKMGNQLLSIIVGREGANPEAPRPIIEGAASWLAAWNPATQKEAWRVPNSSPSHVSGNMATAGNLVFQPSGTNLIAYRADTGEKVWQGGIFPQGTPQLGVGSGPISYQLDGVQYIAVAGGPNSGARVAVYKLGGNAALPAMAAPAPQPVLNPPPNFGTAAQVVMGRDKYEQNCTICHEGAAGRSTGAPDLRTSPFLNTAESFRAVVIDGIKIESGMNPFKATLSNDDAEAIRAHVTSLANTLKSNPQGAGGGRGPGGGAGGAPRAGGPPAAPLPPAEPQVGLHQ
ncbi:MAG: PQQ-binding-like beta-propeller repeat protein [Steroidobacteraceae bacterium]